MRIWGDDWYRRWADLAGVSRAGGNGGPPGTAPRGRSPAAERVSLSERARQVQRLRKLLEGIPEVRMERVEELRERLAQGTYRVDGRRVARRLLSESLFERWG